MENDVGIALKRNVYGSKVVLKTISDEEHEYWIIPRKFSVAGRDEIQQHRATIAKGMKGGVGSVIAKIRKSHPGISFADMSSTEFISQLSDEEIGDLVQGAPNTIEAKAPLVRIMCLYGIGKHNITKDMKETDKVQEWLVDDVLQNEELATEISEVVIGQNPFLLQNQMLGKSGILQSMPSTEPPSQKT